MIPYRPISMQGKPDSDLDTLHDEVMPWMVGPLLNWLDGFLWIREGYQGRKTNYAFVDGLELVLRLRQPLERKYPSSASKDIETRIKAGGTFGLDVTGYALELSRTEDSKELDRLLHQAGSVWEVGYTIVKGTKSKRRYVLTRRDLGAAKAAITEVLSVHQRAGGYLAASWRAVATRNPSPNEGYDKAVKAVEAAAHPVVSPANMKATLGTVLRDMKAKPSKWTFALGELGLVIEMGDRLWTTHHRHGTDERRTDHTLEEADAALHLAIPLVRYFAGGLVAPLDTPT